MVDCTTTQPTAEIFSIELNFYGVSHKLTWRGPFDSYVCHASDGGEVCRHQMQQLIDRFCGKFLVPPDDCENMISEILRKQRAGQYKIKWDGKNKYRPVCDPCASARLRSSDSLDTSCGRFCHAGC